MSASPPTNLMAGQEWCPYCAKWRFFAHTNKGYRVCVYCDYTLFNPDDYPVPDKEE